MEKIVIYNGRTESYYGCTEPTELIKGKKYIVVREEQLRCQTNYYLKGVVGYFNSVWFDEEKIKRSESKIEHHHYVVFAPKIPVIGERFECIRLNVINGTMELKGWKTSIVEDFKKVDENVYKIKTKNSIYYAQIG